MTNYDELRAILEPNAEHASLDLPEGWYDLAIELHKQLLKIYPQYTLLQAKEKFGGLRYYVGSIPKNLFERFNETINRFEDKSYQTCQFCGKAGSTSTLNGWYRTLCPEDKEKLKSSRSVVWDG